MIGSETQPTVMKPTAWFRTLARPHPGVMKISRAGSPGAAVALLGAACSEGAAPPRSAGGRRGRARSAPRWGAADRGTRASRVRRRRAEPARRGPSRRGRSRERSRSRSRPLRGRSAGRRSLQQQRSGTATPARGPRRRGAATLRPRTRARRARPARGGRAIEANHSVSRYATRASRSGRERCMVWPIEPSLCSITSSSERKRPSWK